MCCQYFFSLIINSAFNFCMARFYAKQFLLYRSICFKIGTYCQHLKLIFLSQLYPNILHCQGLVAFSEHGLLIRWWSLGSFWWEKLSRNFVPVQCTKLIFVPPWEGFSPNSSRTSIMANILETDRLQNFQVIFIYRYMCVCVCV